MQICITSIRGIAVRNPTAKMSSWSAFWNDSHRRLRDIILAIEDDRAGAHVGDRLNNSRKPFGEVSSAAAIDPNPALALAHHEPVAVVLDLIDEAIIRRWLLRHGWDAGFDEAGAAVTLLSLQRMRRI
jgi:hypothetical protein